MSVLVGLANGASAKDLLASADAKSHALTLRDEDGARVGTWNPYAVDVEEHVRAGRAKAPPHYAIARALFSSEWRRVGEIDLDAGSKKSGDANFATWFELIGADQTFVEGANAEVGDLIALIAASPDLVDPTGRDKGLIYVYDQDVRLVIKAADRG